MDFSSVSFIGAGNMATAIRDGMLAAAADYNISVFDIDPEKTSRWAEVGCAVCSSEKEAAASSAVVILAVKPQQLNAVLESIAEALVSGGVLVSIAAGVSIDKIKGFVGEYPVVRVMPNACMTVSEGSSAISCSPDVSDEQRCAAVDIFRSCGAVEIIDESLQNSVISVHGSSPAYIFLFCKAVVDEAVAEGIDPDSALNLFCSTLRGSARMMLEDERSLDELISVITSKGGTTEAALRVLDSRGFYDSVREAMRACRDRADELGRM